MKFEHLEQTLRDGTLHMGNPERWPDKNDSAALSAFLTHTGSFAIHATCLTMSPDRYHLWDIFGNKGNGVCLWFSYERFLRDIDNDPSLVAGEVKYYTPIELQDRCKASDLALAKRKQYGDEQEFRVFRQYTQPDNLPDSSSLTFSPESLRRIYINDWIDSYTKQEWKQRINSWTSPRYNHLRILENKTLRYDKWIRILNQLARANDYV